MAKMTKIQALDKIGWERGRFYLMAQVAMVKQEDAELWKQLQPFGVAILGSKAKWDEALREAWLKATPREGYDNTFRLLGLPPMPELTFEQFQATGKDVKDLRKCEFVASQKQFDSPRAGRTYLDGGLWIEREPDGTWYLLLQRSEFHSNKLQDLELALYSYYCAEFS